MELNIEKVKKSLSTLFLGRNIVYYEKIDSTQEEAKRQIDNLSDGTYIVTDNQTNGKGTHDRVWYDEGYENICGSFILKPNCDISKISTLTKVIANCIVESIKKLYDINLDIKEPNDIMFHSKKMAGILTQTSTSNGIVKYIIIGIGINVNQTKFQPEIEEIATSLKKEFEKEFERELIIAEFFNIFEKEYIKLIS